MLVQQKELLEMVSDKLHDMFDEIEEGNKDKLILSVGDILDDLHTVVSMVGEGDA